MPFLGSLFALTPATVPDFASEYLGPSAVVLKPVSVSCESRADSARKKSRGVLTLCVLVVQLVVDRVECYPQVHLCPVVFDFHCSDHLICLIHYVLFVRKMNSRRCVNIHEGLVSRNTTLRQLHLGQDIAVRSISTAFRTFEQRACKPFQLETRPIRVFDQVQIFVVTVPRKLLAEHLVRHNHRDKERQLTD